MFIAAMMQTLVSSVRSGIWRDQMPLLTELWGNSIRDL